MLKTIIILFSSALLTLISGLAVAQDAISTDIFVNNSPGSIIKNHVVAHFTGANTVASITDLGLPSAADIAALHYVNDTTVLFTLKSAAQLGSVTAKAGDVMQWSNGDITIVVSGAALGLNPANGIDALTQNGGALIFSTDIADVVNGVSVTDSDLLTWSDGSPTDLLLAQSVCGIPDESDLSGVHLLDTGHYLMTFSSTTVIAGIPSLRGDVMRCNPESNAVTLYRRFTDLGDDWAFVSIDAVSRSLIERIFKDGFEN